MLLKSLLIFLFTFFEVSSFNYDYDYFAQLSSENAFSKNGSESKMGLDESYIYKSVCMITGKPTLIDGFECQELLALGRFRNHINATGWSYLEIETTHGTDVELQAYSAGVLEGVLTRQILDFHLTNKVRSYCAGYETYCQKLKSYFEKNLLYVKEKIEKAAPDDIYWQAVKHSFLQLTGIWDGFRGMEFNVKIDYEFHEILMLNAKGELYDLEKKFNKTKNPTFTDGINGECSGLVKVAPNNEDILISQVTMSGFQNMIRVLKLYKFGYDKYLFAGHTTTFSSYPGMLYSSDDFALLSSGLAVTETTINIFNNSLFDNIQPYGQLHCWVRAIVANLLARSAREWCKIFSQHNSGTYNNQWNVLDYKNFHPGKELPNFGLFYVLEQTPGVIKYKDMSFYLKQKTYFASYNIPFFKSISHITGFDQQAAKMSWFSWSQCPRARMFKRDHANVTDLDTLTKLMRYNNYKKDEFSKCDCNPPYTAEAAISSRGDLNPANGTYPFPGMGHVNHGALDFKGTNYKLFKQFRFRAWSGPTYDQVPVFKWSSTDFAANVSHVGHPDEWKFKAIEYKWESKINF
uniref:Phospholipase B-like n=1 Tax=Ditylenchus dipsaci TaxID=166011 RepID=A0A915E929_9BILA